MKDYVMTQEQFDSIVKACQPVTYIIVGGNEPRSPQENANIAWRKLGQEMGFVWDTVTPSSKGARHFSAKPQ